jgi:predicted hydrocarbon binding protein
MKGMVFTEFLEMVENIYGFTTADRIISESALGSNGIYTAVGTYPHGEMLTIVSKLSDITGESISSLFYNFGKHLFSRFHDMYPSFFSDNLNSLDFLEAIENYIHPEVIKLYPDAELPGFVTSRKSENVLEMEYTSKRRMHDFAEGLIAGCADHFNEPLLIEKEDVSGDGSRVKFIITRRTDGV